ncbi:hypothetical protein ACQRBN_05725 [Bariatricus sp. SGI.154]|uniref:hypothetical protein n=1 Tax=Bariatricus sp. SGI.154 TaxID=3420549 RepID=UPI003CFE0E58
MSEELSVVKEENTENKIVPLVNKTASDEAENKVEDNVADKANQAKTASETSEVNTPVQSAAPIMAAEPATAEPVTESPAPNTAAAPGSSDTHQSAASQSNNNGFGGNTSQNNSSGTQKSASFIRSSYTKDSSDDFDFDEDEGPKRHFFHFRSKDNSYSRDQLILSRIKDEDLMDYLKLEQERLEFLQQAKEVKEKRLLTAFQLTISLAAIVAVTYLLKDNPTILISILYIVGIIAALNIWKNPRDKSKGKK